MEKYTYDNKSLFRNDRRWFPVMGEIHYSRYPKEDWKVELLKMKEGGVDVVSSYVIWIHHEEIENKWDWSGDRDLRLFVETVKECGLKMILRIGPWVHAETRNGGFPDWLLTKCPEYRTNSKSYFAEVKKLYEEIFNQVKGLLLKDDGPVIGVQIENEFGHCGGLSGTEGEEHMLHLTQMARDAGFDVPLYTATGWGGAVTAGLLPVMGGYCEAPWDPRITEIEPSGNYVFTYERNDHAIGSDYGLGEGITFDMNKFPYLTAELGGGLQVTYKRRPVAVGKDIGGMSLAKMGSGCNLLGYYMYHGGMNPDGKLTTLEENTATGSINDLPVKNYDFRAPLGEYGYSNDTYDEIKLYALFAKDFGEDICETEVFLSKENPNDPQDLNSLRSSLRVTKTQNGLSGYAFVNNFQRRYKMAEHKNQKLQFEYSGTEINFPPVDILDGDMFFLPFGMKIDDAVLNTSLCTPLCRLQNDSCTENAYVFYSAAKPAGKNLIQKSSVSNSKDADRDFYDFTQSENISSKIITLAKDDALKAHKIKDGKKEYLLISHADFYYDSTSSKKFNFITKEPGSTVSFKCFPKLETVPKGFVFVKEDDGFYHYSAETKKCGAEVKCVLLCESKDLKCYELSVTLEEEPVKENILSDCILKIDYEGNCARLYRDDRLLDDHIFVGNKYPWEIGLKRFGLKTQKFILEVDSLKKDAKIFIEDWPQFGGDTAVNKINSITITPVLTL